MKNRRYFLKQGTLATTAMIALKPLTSIARVTSPFTGFSADYGRLVFLHTANLDPYIEQKVIQYINRLENNNANTILLKAGQDTKDETGTLSYDASINESNNLSSMWGDYKIINKGNHRTGIISATPDENDVIERINTLSSWLKKEKNCTMVVCLSQLGYKNKNATDDITLAKKSTHLDIIIGGHDKNFQPHPYIALNRKNEEVIIHSAFGDSGDVGKIEIAVDSKGRKKQVCFADRS